MLTDPSVLRASAAALLARAGHDREVCSQVVRQVSATTFRCRAADVVRQQIALGDALAWTGAYGAEAAAGHLQALADAVEQLRAAMRRERERSGEELQQLIGAAPPGPEADELRRRLTALPPPGDASWAARSAPRVPALPAPVQVPPRPYPASPSGAVAVDLASVRELREGLLVAAGTLSESALGARSAVARAQLLELDAYGLAGSRSSLWLAGLVGVPSPLTRGADEWAAAARELALLEELLAAADRGELTRLLADPRLGRAVDVLRGMRDGRDLAPLLTRDVEWLRDVVPGLDDRLVRESPPRGWSVPSFGWAQALDLSAGVVAAVRQGAQRWHDIADQLSVVLGALKRATKVGTPQMRQRARRIYKAALRNGRAAQRVAGAWDERFARTGRLEPVIDVVTRPVATVSGLRQVPVLSLAMTGYATYGDHADGMSWPGAVAKNVTMTGAGVVAGMGVLALVTAPMWGSVAALGVGAAAGVATGAVLDRYAGGIGSAVQRARTSARTFAAQATGGIARFGKRLTGRPA